MTLKTCKAQLLLVHTAHTHMHKHTLRESQDQQNFHAIELPNIPFISFQFSFSCMHVYLVFCANVCVCECLLGVVGDNKWRQTWTSILVITRRAEQRQWQTSAWGPSIYETGHASNRKTPHTVMAGGKAHRQLITALNFDASSHAGEKKYIIPLFPHRWWDTGSLCVRVSVW